jgi:hypothetical protein
MTNSDNFFLGKWGTFFGIKNEILLQTNLLYHIDAKISKNKIKD